VAWGAVSVAQQIEEAALPKLPRPNSLPALVDEDGGGGFSICEAVGARDWRIEYVRCMLAVGCG